MSSDGCRNRIVWLLWMAFVVPSAVTAFVPTLVQIVVQVHPAHHSSSSPAPMLSLRSKSYHKRSVPFVRMTSQDDDQQEKEDPSFVETVGLLVPAGGVGVLVPCGHHGSRLAGRSLWRGRSRRRSFLSAHGRIGRIDSFSQPSQTHHRPNIIGRHPRRRYFDTAETHWR